MSLEFGALHFLTHPTDAHQAEHLEVRDQTPNWMTERGRGIFFNPEMRDPGEAIADRRWRQQKPRTEQASDDGHEAQNRQRRSDEMQSARHRPPMSVDVVRPERGV